MPQDSLYRLISRDIDRHVFIDILPRGIQKDGQRVLDAIDKGDRAALAKIRQRYVRDAGLAQGGGGAGPGRVKKPRRGAVTVHNCAEAWLERSP